MTTPKTKSIQPRQNVSVQGVENPGLFEVIGRKMPTLATLLPRDIELEQFKAATWLHIQEMWELGATNGLKYCFQDTIVTAIIKAATHGMLPGRDCHFLPFHDKRRGGRVATYVENYFGIIRALERSGKVAKAFAHPVYGGDVFVVDYLSDTFSHVPAAVAGKPQGDLRMFYGCILMKDGTRHLEVLTLDDVLAVKARAPGHETGPWVTDFIMMGKKTAIKRAAKPVKLTPEAQGILEEDEEQTTQAPIALPRAQKTIGELWGATAPEEEEIDLETGVVIAAPESIPSRSAPNRGTSSAPPPLNTSVIHSALHAAILTAQKRIDAATEAMQPGDTLPEIIERLEKAMDRADQARNDAEASETERQGFLQNLNDLLELSAAGSPQGGQG